MNEDLIWYISETIIPAAFELLPGKMNSTEAKAQLLAIALQESKFQHRIQVPNGPAHGFWQFERNGGIKGVLSHPVTAPIIAPILTLFCYDHDLDSSYQAVVHNDVLAVCYARLLLWTDPRKLPTPIEAQKGWKIYLKQWRPGKPHEETWGDCFNYAWRVVKGG